MPLTLNKLATNQATITVPYKGETITLSYVPGKVTDAVLARIDQSLGERAAVLCDIVVSWDIYQDQEGGPTLPITPEGMALLPSDLKLVLARAILKDVRPEAGAA